MIGTGDLNDLIYNASFAAINTANGQTYESKPSTGLNTTQDRIDFNVLSNEDWRKTSYKFCQNGCKGLVSVKPFDTVNTAVNGYFHQVVNGSCRDTFSISDEAW